jgi:hypothetical protein
MGYVLAQQGQPQEAEPYVREAIAISLRVNGDSHQDTLTYIHNLGMLLRDEKKFDQAETQMQIVAERGGRSLGLSHPITMSATRCLAGLQIDQMRCAEAEALLETVEPLVLKSKNERTRASFLADIGKARAGLGKFAEAESSLLEAERLWVESGGDEDGNTRACIQAIVDNYAAWHQAQPVLGYDAKASAWRAKLDAVK